MASSRWQILSSRYWDGWFPEQVAIIVGTVCLAIQIVLLARSDRKVYFDMGGITINTLVALLSALSRACLMAALASAISQIKWVQFIRSPRMLYDLEIIDGASRDSWGRMNLLWRSPASLASLGALGALLALAFDPFNQLLVSTASQLQYTTQSPALIPRATRYSKGTWYPVGWSAWMPTRTDEYLSGSRTCDASPIAQTLPPLIAADMSLQAAVLNGLREDVNLEQLWLTTRQCATGNCTWPTYTSLAVCSKCLDVGDRLTRHRTPKGGWQDVGEDRNSVAVLAAEGEASALILPNGMYLNNGDGRFWDGNFSSPLAFNIMSSGGSPLTEDSVAFQNVPTLIWTHSFIRANPPEAPQRTKPWPDTDVEATECILYWCTMQFNTSTVNGRPVENFFHKDPQFVFRDPKSWTPENGSMYGAGPRLDRAQTASLAYDACVSKKARTDLRLDKDFNVSQAAVLSTSSYLWDVLTLQQDYVTPMANWTNDTSPGYPRNWWFNGIINVGDQPGGPSTITSLVRAKSLSERFRNLAYSMTNAIRVGADNALQVEGETAYMRIIIVVRWQWIALPALVWILTVAQVTLAAIATKRSGAPIWKSSALALVSRSGKCSDFLEGKEKISEMHDTSKQHRVDIFRDEEDERLAMMKRSPHTEYSSSFSSPDMTKSPFTPSTTGWT